MKFFENAKRIELKEYASNSEMEGYTGIVLDKSDNIFKVVTGQFHDKKDFYEKLTARGMVVRKVFEQKVWRWMEDNAPNNLTAYLMFSTAFSKWKGNNVLGDYYVKLLNDIPQLNREKVKGDPKTMGLDKTIRTDESVLTEVSDEALGKYFIAPPRDYYANTPGMKKSTLTITPINANGTLSKFTKPLVIDAYAFLPHGRTPSLKDIHDLNAMRSLYTLLKVQHNGEAFPGWAQFGKFQFQIDDMAPFVADKTTAINYYQNLKAKYQQDDKNYTNLDHVPVEKPTNSSVLGGLMNAYRKAKLAGASKEELADIGKRIVFTKQAMKWERPDVATALMTNSNKVIEALEKESKAASEGKDVNWPLLQVAMSNVKNNFVQRLSKANSFETQLDPVYKAIQNAYNELQSFRDKTTEFKKLDSKDLISTFNNYIKDFRDFYKIGAKAGKPTQDARGANMAFNSYETSKAGLTQQLRDLYNTKYSQTNPIHDGDSTERFFNTYDKARDLEKKIATKDESAELEEQHVNDGVTAMYRTQPIGGQPMDVYPTNRGMLPVSGLFLEQDGEVGFNPILFDGDKLKPDVREALLKIADKFKEKLDIQLQPIDVYLTGSNGNYNYNQNSDIDLHLVYIYEEAGAAAEVLSKYLIAQKKLFNTEYNITIKGIPVEVGCEDLDHPLVAGGIYSVQNDKWLMRPSELPSLHNDKLPPYMNKVISEIERAIESHNAELIGNLWKSLGALRKESLAKEGEFGAGNLMFKKLRADGYLDRLKQAYYDSESKALSLEALEEI